MGELADRREAASSPLPADPRWRRLGTIGDRLASSSVNAAESGHDMSNRRLRLLPPGKRDWGEAYLAEFGDGARLGPLVLQAWLSTIKQGVHMSTVVATASIVNVAMGSFLVGIYLWATADNPVLMLVIGACLVAQGGFTIWYMSRTSNRSLLSTRILLSGETLAVLVGTGGLVGSIIQNTGITLDPEYGPVAVSGLIAFQAAVTLYTFAVHTDRPGATAST